MRESILAIIKNSTGKINNRALSESWWNSRPQYLDKYDYINKLFPRYSFNDKLKILWHSTSMIEPSCKVCGNIVKIDKKGIHEYCSCSCSAKSLETIEKRKNTTKQKYGVEYISQTKEIQRQIKENSLNKTGISSPNQQHWGKEIHDLLLNREWLIEQHHILKKSPFQIHKELNEKVHYGTIIHYMNLLNVEHRNYSTSYQEKEIVKFLHEECNISNIELNTRKIIHPYEIDIFLPDYNLAIEFDGIYWHSYNRKETKEEIEYHLRKTLECSNKGIHLLHIFSNEWEEKKEIWKSIISSKLGINQRIHARKCDITTNNNLYQFFANNHLQGSTIVRGIELSLEYNGNVVAGMSFCKSRFSKEFEWELLRFACKKGVNVVGGASKLFKHFVTNYNPKNIVSYSDKRHATGLMYSKLGFNFIRTSSPNYFYFKKDSNVLESRMKFQKHKLERLLNNFDVTLSEYQNMFNNNYRRIWDCGNDVWSYTN